MLAIGFVFAPSHWMLAALSALAAHETAHVLAMALCGVQTCTVELTPFGGMADAECFQSLSCGRRACIAAAGVCASALLAWACLRFAPVQPFWYAFLTVNTSLALFNCLPVWPLDGAQAILAFVERFGWERAMQRFLKRLAYLLAGCMLALGLYGAWHGHINLSLFLTAPYLAYAAHASTVAHAVRHMQSVDGANKLQDGHFMPVQAYACTAEPTRIQAARLVRTLPAQRYHLLYLVDMESGKIKDTWTEQELIRRLFVNNSETEKERIGGLQKVDKQ